MTTFEITIIVLLAAIVVLLILVFTGMATTHVKMKEGFECLAKKIEYCDSKLGYIKGAAQDISQQLDGFIPWAKHLRQKADNLENAWACDITSIIGALREEVAAMNKEREYWQQVRIQAAIAAMQGMLANPAHHKVQVESGVPFSNFYAINAVMCADALIEELKKGGQDDNNH